ncbi:MAG: hypothetical protein IGS48_02505 [Oscillatoriales cyanobacterium C42_A2020_001]|nr:hypothetical protein [Leptolyngbyaceae cyanobacterium C42_A2020_001]
MTQSFIQTVQQQAEIALTYLLTLVDGSQHWLVPVDALNGVVMDDPNDQGIMTGKLYGGGEIEVAISDIFMVEEKRYRVQVDNGQGRRSQDMSEKDFNQAMDRAKRDESTGEVKTTFKRVHDRKTGESFDF